MAALTAIVATGAMMLSAPLASARAMYTGGDVPAHLMVQGTDVRCGETEYESCCPAEYGSCAPGLVCMGEVCEPCGDAEAAACDERAGRLWSATFEGDAPELVAIREHFDGHLPTFLAGPEAQGGLYGAGEYGSYGWYGDELPVYYGAYGEYGEYGELPGYYGSDEYTDSPRGLPVKLDSGEMIGSPPFVGKDSAADGSVADGSVADRSVAIADGSDASIPGTPNELSEDGPELTEDTESTGTSNSLVGEDPLDTANKEVPETKGASGSSLAPAGAAVGGVAVLLAGVGVLAYAKRATLFKSPASAV